MIRAIITDAHNYVRCRLKIQCLHERNTKKLVDLKRTNLRKRNLHSKKDLNMIISVGLRLYKNIHQRTNLMSDTAFLRWRLV